MFCRKDVVPSCHQENANLLKSYKLNMHHEESIECAKNLFNHSGRINGIKQGLIKEVGLSKDVHIFLKFRQPPSPLCWEWLIIRDIIMTSELLSIEAKFNRNLWTMTQKTAFSKRIAWCQKWNSNYVVNGIDKVKKIKKLSWLFMEFPYEPRYENKKYWNMEGNKTIQGWR